MGRVVRSSRFRGPSMVTKGVLGGHSCTSWFMIPRLVRRPVHVPCRSFFFFKRHPKKKKMGVMLVHYRIFAASPFLMPRCVYQGEYSLFSIVSCPLRCLSMPLWFAPPKKKKRGDYTRELQLLRRLNGRQWSNQMLLPCGALLAVRDGLKIALRASGRFLRSGVFLCKGNSFFHDCTVILRLVHDADSGKAQSVQTLAFLIPLLSLLTFR